MTHIRPIYIKLLVLALIIFIMGVSLMLSDLYFKVGQIEHTLMHLTGKH
jgi:hypothetical protein